MFRMARRELSARRLATSLALSGLVAATLGFLLLAATSQTTEAQLRGDINHAWGGRYDLLVRPATSVSTLESERGLVRPNYLTTGAAGITDAQVEAIRQVAGVQVAAPLAVVGVFNWPTNATIDLSQLVDQNAPLTLLRIQVNDIADAGLSRYSVETRYLAIAPQGVVTFKSALDIELQAAGSIIKCTYPITCWGKRILGYSYPNGKTPVISESVPQIPGLAPGVVGASIPFSQPVVVAGVDPQAEAQLSGITSCVSSGRYLQTTDQVQVEHVGAGQHQVIPALAATTSPNDETLQVQVGPSDAAAIQTAGVSKATGPTDSRTFSFSADGLYQRFLQTSPAPLNRVGYSTVGEVSYHDAGLGSLSVLPVAANSQGYELSGIAWGIGAAALPVNYGVPPEVADTWFRQVDPHHPVSDSNFRKWNLVGRFDNQCASGLASSQSSSPSYPTLPGGGKLQPSRALGGYVNTPPMILTTLSAARFLSDPSEFLGGSGDNYITAVRVRVAATQTASDVAAQRLARVAADIQERTGLVVDIVKGSSAKGVDALLPAGQAGRPALILSEQWTSKGVAIRFLHAVTVQNLALFVLVLVSAAIVVGETAFISVSRRKPEFAMLRALGWSQRSIASLVELETAILGVVAGTISIAIGVPVAISLGLGVRTWQLIAALPLAVVIAVLAALVPAIVAGRGSVISQMLAKPLNRNSVPLRSAFGLGLRELRYRWSSDILLAMLASLLGLTLIGGAALVVFAFRSQLDTTVLGQYLSAEVRGFHLAVAALTAGIAVVAVAEIVMLGYLERRSQYAALRALGWPVRSLMMIVGGQAMGIVAVAASGAACVLVITGVALGASPMALVEAGGATAAAAGLMFAIAVIGPIIDVVRDGPAVALRGE